MSGVALQTYDGRYISGPDLRKAELLGRAGAVRLERIPDDLGEVPSGHVLVVVIYNRHWDGALICTEADLRRVHDDDTGRRMEAFVIPRRVIRSAHT